MGNSISVPEFVPSEEDVTDFIRNNVPIFSELAVELEENEVKRRRTRNFSRVDWWNTSWGKIILDKDIRDITTTAGQEFRRRFRVPGPFFLDWLVPKCTEEKIFNSGDGSGRSWHVIPIEIKLLMSLRILGRGNVLDDIVELSGISKTSVWSIFHNFVTNFSKKFESFINMPEGEDLESVLEVYRRLGFPGCVGSIDCTHVRWWGCPSNLTNICTGKEGYPTLSFQVVVDHSRLIRHVSRAGWGTMNDINMCQQVDTIIRDSSEGFLNDYGRRNKYKEVVFTLFDQDGQPRLYKGAYLICDGGYEGLTILINPNVNSCERSAVIWAEFLESVRKDVECTFGLLKCRFHILKGIRFRSKSVVESTFKTCCIIHNMLLQLDGYDIAAWELNARWDSINMLPEAWDLPELVNADDGDIQLDNNVAVPNADVQEDNDNGVIPFEGIEEIDEVQDNNVILLSPARRNLTVPVVIDLHQPTELKEVLIQHFSVCFRLGRIQWPKSMSQVQRQLLNRPVPITEPGAIMRALRIVRDTLYTKDSHLRLIRGEQLVSCIGLGLFSYVIIRKGEIISDFVGEFVNDVEAERRITLGFGGYQVNFCRGVRLDCYNFKHVCKVSFANSPKNCYNTNTGAKAISNAIIVIDSKGKNVYLRAIKDIGPNDEILYDYGPRYEFPVM